MAMKAFAGLLAVMVVSACGAPAMVTPTPLNTGALQAGSMQTYGPGALTSGATTSQMGFTDTAAPTVATGEEMPPAAVKSTSKQTTQADEPTDLPAAEEPAPEPSPTATVPIMADPTEDIPQPKPTLVQKAKTVLSNVVSKVKSIFKK
jgi:hypothetical protein